MLTVETYIASSKISGIGLFAGQKIPKGYMVWYWQQNVDTVYHNDLIKVLPMRQRLIIKQYAYRKDGLWYLCADDARFMNHSLNPSVVSDAYGADVAAWDIRPGEEITCNYCTFDEDWKRKLAHSPAGAVARVLYDAVGAVMKDDHFDSDAGLPVN